MKSLTLTSPPAIFNQTVAALCNRKGYTGDPNDEIAKLEFAKEALLDLLGEVNREYVSQLIRHQAQVTVQQQIELAHQQITLTRNFVTVVAEDVITTGTGS